MREHVGKYTYAPLTKKRNSGRASQRVGVGGDEFQQRHVKCDACMQHLGWE